MWVSVKGDCFVQVLPTPRDSQGLGLGRHSSLVRWYCGLTAALPSIQSELLIAAVSLGTDLGTSCPRLIHPGHRPSLQHPKHASFRSLLGWKGRGDD